MRAQSAHRTFSLLSSARRSQGRPWLAWRYCSRRRRRPSPARRTRSSAFCTGRWSLTATTAWVPATRYATEPGWRGTRVEAGGVFCPNPETRGLVQTARPSSFPDPGPEAHDTFGTCSLRLRDVLYCSILAGTTCFENPGSETRSSTGWRSPRQALCPLALRRG